MPPFSSVMPVPLGAQTPYQLWDMQLRLGTTRADAERQGRQNYVSAIMATQQAQRQAEAERNRIIAADRAAALAEREWNARRQLDRGDIAREERRFGAQMGLYGRQLERDKELLSEQRTAEDQGSVLQSLQAMNKLGASISDEQYRPVWDEAKRLKVPQWQLDAVKAGREASVNADLGNYQQVRDVVAQANRYFYRLLDTASKEAATTRTPVDVEALAMKIQDSFGNDFADFAVYVPQAMRFEISPKWRQSVAPNFIAPQTETQSTTMVSKAQQRAEMANKLEQQYPNWTDEEIMAEARRRIP